MRVPQSLILIALLAPALREAGAQQTDTARIAAVVVTATRVPISALLSPATVDVVSGDDLRRRGVVSIAAALQSLPGLTFAQNGSFGATTSLFLRGGESKYVKVLIDGVPVNDPGGAIDFGRLTTDNVERIEVVRGPVSVLYGADAVTGVIQIFTRRGRGPTRRSVSARGGTYGSMDAEAAMAGEVGAGDFSLAIARHDTRGIYPRNSDFENSVASGAIRLSVDSKTDIRLSLRYNDGEFHYPTNGGGTVVDTNARNTQDRTVLGLDVNRVINAKASVQFSLMTQGSAGGTDDRQDTQTGSGLQTLDRVRRRGADVRGNFELAGTTLTVGAHAEQQDQHNETHSVFGTSQSTSIFRAARRNTALYAQTLTRLPGSLVVTAGGRRDANEAFGVFGTYRAGASWLNSTGTHVRASVGTAFREPTFLENFSTGFVVGNRNLEPERSATWEAGIRQSLWGDRVMLGLTHFDQRFRKMIDYTGATTACGASYCNVARASAKGRELEARVSPGYGLVLDANLAHLETKVLEPGDTASGSLYRPGESLIRRPTTSWNLGAGFARARGSVDVRVVHVGERADRDFRPYPALSVVVPAFTRTDVGGVLPLGQFAPRMVGAELTLRVENLFDEEYESVFNFRTPRRMVLVGARVTF